MSDEPNTHFTLWNLGRQQLQVTCDGERTVADTGLLLVRAVEKPLRVIADLAALLPDPRSPKFLRHSVEALLTQQVYARLAGYPDHNDADELRADPLFQILSDVSPDQDKLLASGSTQARFLYAYTL
ncbi:MAG: transposase, partial [Acidobacteria bacterium]|nr:transposase [Acidobacteriota bacterium]